MYHTIACIEWLKNIKIPLENTCSFCDRKNIIAHIFVECKSLTLFRKNWAKWWENIIDFHIREEGHINE